MGAQLRHDPLHERSSAPHTALPSPSPSGESPAAASIPSFPPLVYLLQPSLRPSASQLLAPMPPTPKGLGQQSQMGPERWRSPQEMGNQDQETFRSWINSTTAAKPLHGGQRDGTGSNRGREKKLCRLHPHRRGAREVTATGFIRIDAGGCYQPGPCPSANERPSHGARNKIQDSPLLEEGTTVPQHPKPKSPSPAFEGKGFAALAANHPQQPRPRALDLLIFIPKRS